jgi:hypothetical protein
MRKIKMHFRYALVLLSLLSSIPVLAASVKIDPRDILPNTVDSTEFGSLNGARSNLQTQIDNIGFSSTQTLQTVTARGSNTTANVVLAGYWTRIGISDGTETWTGVTAGLNLGYNTGARTNIGTGAINSGVVVSPGLQDASGSGSENHGRVYNSGSQIVTGSGSENHGVVTQSGVQTNGGRGSLNFGSVHGGIQYITGDGSANFGDTGAGEYQTNTATAAFNFGSKNVNSHDYSAVFGYGVNSFETNAAHARKYFEDGMSLENKYVKIAAPPVVTNLLVAGTINNITNASPSNVSWFRPARVSMTVMWVEGMVLGGGSVTGSVVQSVGTNLNILTYIQQDVVFSRLYSSNPVSGNVNWTNGNWIGFKNLIAPTGTNVTLAIGGAGVLF